MKRLTKLQFFIGFSVFFAFFCAFLMLCLLRNALNYKWFVAKDLVQCEINNNHFCDNLCAKNEECKHTNGKQFLITKPENIADVEGVNNSFYGQTIAVNLNESENSNQPSINFCFKHNEITTNYTLKIRKEAQKYFCSGGKVDFDLLSTFVKTAYKRMIEPKFICEFCFENFNEVISDLCNKYESLAEDAEISVMKNTGKINMKNAKNGLQIDKNTLFLSIFNNLLNKNQSCELSMFTVYPGVKEADLADGTNLRGEFKTNFSTSSSARAHNVKTALSSFDGLILMPGEVLSFNKTTGVRSAENGYLGAKIIIDGKFEDGLGGGVCQVSTTLYNASLLAGLKVVEANQHSLKVGYVEPSFDAMVNYGSSDLKIQNNTNTPVIFACFCENGWCGVKIYGEKNPYKIVRRSEKIKDVDPPEEKSISYEEFIAQSDKNAELARAKGGEQINSFYAIVPKAGLKSEGYLDFYENGELAFSTKIRQNTYASTQGVRVVNEGFVKIA